ncbi:MAG TPA: DUF257 family protein [Thermococcaceae archaeon]|nr:DUF257 family protein [Thermococcaceae archaeon]
MGMDEIKVIKLGGILNVGQVIGKVSVSETAILQKEYDRIFEQIKKDKIVNIVVGFDKYLTLLGDKKDILSALHDVLKYVGNEKRIAFYFVDRDLLELSIPMTLPILEEGFTRVVRIEGNHRNPKFTILKSLGF